MIDTVKGVPVQLPLVGVTVYATVIAAFVEFVMLPEIELAFVPAAVPVIPVTVGADHEYVVPVGTMFPEPLDGVTVKLDPEQIVCVCTLTVAVGATVTVTVKLVPSHAGVVSELGVTVYTTLMAAFVVFVNVPEIELAFVPAAVPVIPVTEGADQEYVVPVGIKFPLPSVGDTVNVPPEQIVAV